MYCDENVILKDSPVLKDFAVFNYEIKTSKGNSGSPLYSNLRYNELK